MTYCVGLLLEKGLVFMSDTRTNSGVDNLSVYQKMFTWTAPGERLITIMTAGNLATTQCLVSLLDERSKTPQDRDPSILKVSSMFQVAKLIGDTLREIILDTSPTGLSGDSSFSANIILGGQIKGGQQRLFLIYPEGNFIEASEDTPFFQSGETKYGRPILVRAFDRNMTFENAVKLLMVSFDSTLKANLSVGLPLDLQIYERDSLIRGMEKRFESNDPYYLKISEGWSAALKEAQRSLPNFHFEA